MNQSKAKVVISTILGKVYSIIGYTLVVIMALALIGGIKDAGTGTYVLLVIFIALGVWLIMRGIKTKHRIKRFRTYVGLISKEHINSLEVLASSTAQSVDFVKNDLQKMINKKFFANAHIDKKTNEIIIGSSNPQRAASVQSKPTHTNVVTVNENAQCPGCGAMNLKQRGALINCEYCGTPLK